MKVRHIESKKGTKHNQWRSETFSMCDHWQQDTMSSGTTWLTDLYPKMALFFSLFLKISEHPSYPWLEPQLWLQFPSRGRVEESSDWSSRDLPGRCSDTSRGYTLCPGRLLLLQPTMSLYCEADKLRPWETLPQLLTALRETDRVHQEKQKQRER